ncbi:MAG TPA: SpoIIE family protein phosphatase [Terriglobia bacterium]|nr:SpoIIE family protein phosphatase [Terriglobia bacterium]
MNAPRLKWKSADGRSQEYLVAAPEVVIGRGGGADLLLPSLHVSRRHAKLSSANGSYEIEDLESRYGTFLNGERVTRSTLRHGDRIVFGKGEEFFFFVDSAEPRSDLDTTKIVQRSLTDLGRVLPAEASDLEKMLCVLNLQNEWNQVFTPENALHQILESALRISGAERAFIMTQKADGYGYSAGMDGSNRRLSESQFGASQSVVRDVVAKRQPIFMVGGIQEEFASQQSIVGMNLRAMACLPLLGIRKDGDSAEILGILYLDSTKAMHSLSGLDQKILSKLAKEAGNVLERVEMMKSIEQRKTLERDLLLAEDTQRSLLPREIPRLDFLKLTAYCKPTRYVGGDFYDFQVMPTGELLFVIADVSGKGVAASVLSSMILGCLQLRLQDGDHPAKALNRLNRFLCTKSSGKFATMFLCVIAPDGVGQYISAGHNPAYLYRAADGSIEELTSTNLILGAFDFATFDAVPIEVRPGDILLAYSDGLTEAESAHEEMFGEERVKEIICREASAGAAQVSEALIASIAEFTKGHDQSDDITLVIAERRS